MDHNGVDNPHITPCGNVCLQTKHFILHDHQNAFALDLFVDYTVFRCLANVFRCFANVFPLDLLADCTAFRCRPNVSAFQIQAFHCFPNVQLFVLTLYLFHAILFPIPVENELY